MVLISQVIYRIFFPLGSVGVAELFGGLVSVGLRLGVGWTSGLLVGTIVSVNPNTFTGVG